MTWCGLTSFWKIMGKMKLVEKCLHCINFPQRKHRLVWDQADRSALVHWESKMDAISSWIADCMCYWNRSRYWEKEHPVLSATSTHYTSAARENSSVMSYNGTRGILWTWEVQMARTQQRIKARSSGTVGRLPHTNMVCAFSNIWSWLELYIPI